MPRTQFQHLAVVTIVALLVLLAADRLKALVHPASAHPHERIVRLHASAPAVAFDVRRLDEEARRMGEEARRMGEEARRHAEQMRRELEQHHRTHGDRCRIEQEQVIEVR